MNVFKHIPSWLIWPAALLALSAFFRFVMTGYAYIAHTLAFFALFIIALHLTGGGLRKAIIVLVCLGFAYFCAVEVPIIKNSRTDEDPGRKYLIVLGAAVHGDEASLALTHRLEGALEYLEEYPDSVAIVSGGQGDGEDISEAECMERWLLEQGISAERIIKEDKSTSTAENLENSFAIIRARGDDPDGNVAICSSSYHLYRAKSMAKLLGADTVGVSCPFGYPIFTLGCYIREAFGVTHLWVFGL